MVREVILGSGHHATYTRMGQHATPSTEQSWGEGELSSCQ